MSGIVKVTDIHMVKGFMVMAKGKKKKFATAENPEFAHWMHALGSSNATQPHDTRPHRQRSRADARNAAIRDSRD